MSPLITTVALWLADYHLLASALIAVALATMLAARQPARRMAIAKATLAALAVLAILCALPGWSLVHLLAAEAPAPPPTYTKLPASSLPATPTISTSPAVTFTSPTISPPASASPNTTPQPAAPTAPIDWPATALALQTFGSSLILAYLASGGLYARRLRRRAHAAPATLQQLLAPLTNPAPAPQLLISDAIAMPVALGTRRPAIILPAALLPLPTGEGRGEGPGDGTKRAQLPVATELSAVALAQQWGEGEPAHSLRKTLTPILAHEWAHIAAGDLRTLAATRLLLILLWPQPLFWLLRRIIRLDQETLADAAAAEVAGRIPYAEQLLQLARNTAASPIARRTPRLAGAVGLWEGPAQLKRRVIVLLDEHLTILRDCSRSWRVGSASAALIAAGLLSLITLQREATARASEPASDASAVPIAPQGRATDDYAAAAPSVEEIVRVLKTKEDAIETLQVRCVCLDERTLLKPGTKHDPQFPVADNLVSMNGKAQIAWEATREGAACMTANVQVANTRDDGTTFDTRETIVSHCEDGFRGRYLKTNRQRDGVDQPDIGASTTGYLRTHVPPFDFATRHFGKPISRLLSEGEAKFIATERWDDRPVIVVEAEPKAVTENYILRQRFWVDFERGVAVRRQSFVQRSEGKPWGLAYQLDGKKFSEAAPGVWLPGTADIVEFYVTEKGQDFLTHKERYVMTDWIVNQKIDPSRFDVDLPALTPDTSQHTPER